MSDKASFDWTNNELKAALDAMAEVCAPENRFPVVTSIRAYRNHKRLAEAWEPAEQVRNTLIQEYGEKVGDAGSWRITDPDGLAAFAELMQANGVAVELEVLSLAEVEKGYVKDPATGTKEPLGISPSAIGVLMDLHVLTEDGKVVAEEVEGEALERDEAQEDAPE